MSPNRVLFVSTVTTRSGGAEKSLLELARHLPSCGWTPALAAWQPGPLVSTFVDLGFETFLFSQGAQQPGQPLGGTTETFPSLTRLVESLLDTWTTFRPIRAEVAWLRTTIEDGGFQLVHSNCDLSVPATCVAAREAGAAYLAHIRDHWRRWDNSRIASSLRRADATIVASQYMARRFRGLGIEPLVVPNPVAGTNLTRQLTPEERGHLRKVLGAPDSFTAAFVGRLDSQKQPEVGVRAVTTLSRRQRGVTLVVAGRGRAPLEKGLREKAEACPPPGTIRFLGHRSDVQEWLPAMDALLVPSREEPFGRMIVEGMLSALPVIAADEGAAPEILRDGETGLLVPAGDSDAFADALERLLSDPEWARELGRAGQAEARLLYHPERIATEVATLYSDTLAKTHARRT